MKKVDIYTDGACRGNPGPGGWGALLIHNDVKKTIYGGEKDTTNNRMEMIAVIEALKLIKSDCEISLYTDSKYVMDGVNKWLSADNHLLTPSMTYFCLLYTSPSPRD